MASTLYDMPVSNNGARVRFILKAKGLEKKGYVKIVPPSDLGGLKSEAYLKLNPQGKMVNNRIQNAIISIVSLNT